MAVLIPEPLPDFAFLYAFGSVYFGIVSRRRRPPKSKNPPKKWQHLTGITGSLSSESVAWFAPDYPGLVSGHLKVTLIIITVNIAIIVFALFLNQLQINVNIQFILVLLAGIMFSLIPSVILKIKSAEELRSSKQLKQVG